MSLELTGVHGLLKQHKLFTHKLYHFPCLLYHFSEETLSSSTPSRHMFRLLKSLF